MTAARAEDIDDAVVNVVAYVWLVASLVMGPAM